MPRFLLWRMKQTLYLASFDAPDAEPLAIRQRSQTLRRGSWAHPPENNRLSDRVPTKLVIARTVFRGLSLAGRVRVAGLLVWVLAFSQVAEATTLAANAVWTEGVILTSDPAHKTFTLAQGGRRGTSLLTWTGQTHTWDRQRFEKKGSPVNPAVLQSHRTVRVLVERKGGKLVARRIILLSGLTSKENT